MSSLSLFDPEYLPLIEMQKAAPFTLSRETLNDVRGALATMMPPPSPEVMRAQVDVAERVVPGPLGSPDVRVLVYTPRTGPATGRPAYLNIHGGGYILGNPEMNDPQNRLLAENMGCVIVAPDYRLSPETTFPGPVEDCYAALKWLHGHVGELGVDTARIAVGGESAGGGLAAGLCLLARDRREVPICFQLLIQPMLDDRTAATVKPHAFAGEFTWTAQSNVFGWEAMLGHAPGEDGVSGYAAPARAEDVSGLPPTFISVGALDLFADEDLAYARRLMQAGVPTEFHIYPGADHSLFMPADARLAQIARRDMRDALRQGLGAH